MQMEAVILSILALVMAGDTRVQGADKVEEKAAAAETRRVRGASAPPVRQNTYRVVRMKDNPTIDADWNKAAWKDVTPALLEYYMGEEPMHQPRVQAKLAYDDQALYVIWKVEDRFVLARRTKHQEAVYRDSCVELFFTPGGDPQKRGYFNLETNCTGVKLLGIHVGGKRDQQATADDFASIVTASSLKGPIEPEIAEPTTWTLEYKIPFRLVEQYTTMDRPGSGITWRANLYKCADDASHPHWLTWSPVTNAKPSFHLPKYFGVLAFE